MGMKVVATTRCFAFGHPEFHLVCDAAVPRADVDVLAFFLEESVENGARFDVGDLVAMGSMLLRVAMVGESFTLEEPDFRSMPIGWVEGVTRSMRHLRWQRDVAASVGLDGEIDLPSIRSSLLVGADLSPRDETIVLDRMKSDRSDSGWFVGRSDSALAYHDEASVNRMSVYQAMVHWPKIGGFLGLPAGCRVETGGRSPRITRDGRALEIKPGSLIDALARGLKTDPAR